MFDLKANCRTTAMGIMPHTDIERALKLALSLDIPFWPQLPKVSYFEDMYVQASEHFPGMAVDVANRKIRFDTERFKDEVTAYSEKLEKEDTFVLSQAYSAVYHRFLQEDLTRYAAIRGQLIGPVSFGFNVVDENIRPVIYNDEVRTIIFDFLQRKTNAQCRELKRRNPNAFVWLDEPGLGWVFSGLSGYSDIQARADYADFLTGLQTPKALHLCANVNLPYLLALGVEILSFDAYQIQTMPKGYVDSVAAFLKKGGIICWGIVPTDSTSLGQETAQTLAGRLTQYWEVIERNSNLSLRDIAGQALIAPARCCLKNIGLIGTPETAPRQDKDVCQISTVEERIVEKAFDHVQTISRMLMARFGFQP